MAKDNKKVKKKVKVNIQVKRVFLLLFSLGIIGLSASAFILYGPWSWVRERLITTAMTTMSHQYLAQIFFDEDTINEVMANNRVIEVDEDTNPDLINIDDQKPGTKYSSKYEKEILERDKGNDLFKVIRINEMTYKGYLVEIYKPEIVKIGVT